jgi:hypothetical protein
MTPFWSISGPKYKAHPLPVHPGHMTIHRKKHQGLTTEEVISRGVRLDTPTRQCNRLVRTHIRHTRAHTQVQRMYTHEHAELQKVGESKGILDSKMGSYGKQAGRIQGC